jgi:hypothetical protein
MGLLGSDGGQARVGVGSVFLYATTCTSKVSTFMKVRKSIVNSREWSIKGTFTGENGGGGNRLDTRCVSYTSGFRRRRTKRMNRE